MSVINLADRRPPVSYTVRITHHWDDSLEVFVEDVADDERSRQSVADALARAARVFANRCEIRDAPGRKWFARERWPEVQTQSSLHAEAALPSRRRWPLGDGSWQVTMKSAAE